MEIVGNDNRIRALFSEIKLADAQAEPSFFSVWNRAEARSMRPRHAFSLPLATVTALLALTLGALAFWSIYYLNPSNPRYQVFAELRADKMITPETRAAVDVTTPGSDQRPRHRPIRSLANRSVIRDESLVAKNKDAKATTIETWQSPTSALLTSPADGLVKSLPQLNENANELKSFLPARANEKEK
jgi:hypothetical protein